ncbi:hypothetical protein AHAS_Ahas16G0057200 [Arachis hypogaea]
MAPKSTAMKTLRSAKKNVVARNIQLKEVGGSGDLPSPSKSDSGASASIKIVTEPTLPPSDSGNQVLSLSPLIPEPKPKKCKTAESASIYEQDFDAVAFLQKTHLFT